MTPSAAVRLQTKTNAPPQRRRVLVAWLAASAVLHALVLVAMPQADERIAPRVEILRVEIEKPQPPREIEPPRGRARAPRPEPPPEPRAEPRREQRRQAPAKSQRAAPPEPPLPAVTPREVLSLPREAARPEQAYAVPAPPPPATAPRATEGPRMTQPAPQAAAPPAAKPSPPKISNARVIDSPVRYPRTAEQGRVTLRVLVNRDGRVATVALEKTSGYASLDQHALAAVRRWRFAPARQDDEPVAQWLTVNVDY